MAFEITLKMIRKIDYLNDLGSVIDLGACRDGDKINPLRWKTLQIMPKNESICENKTVRKVACRNVAYGMGGF